MKILYISVHSILEYDELSLLTKLGHDCFSLGAYGDPKGHRGLPRPGIEGMKYHKDLDEQSRLFPRTEIPQDFIDQFDVILCMHQPDILVQNWPRMRHKKVIWRSIGQSTPSVEATLKPLRDDGLKIIRYSPKEACIPGYIGSDAMIRFYKDHNELKDWNGSDKSVINFTQSLKGRRHFCHYDHIIETMSGFQSKVYGTGNDDLGALNGGELPWEQMKGKLRDSRVFVYGGTWPASYTLSFQEAWMTGTPIVSIGKRLANGVPNTEQFDFFEVPEMIQHGESGFYADDIGEMKSYVRQLLDNDDLAKKISEKSRERAISLFGIDTIKPLWEEFLKNL